MTTRTDGGSKYPVSKPDEVWESELSPEQYRVCILGGTERPFTGEYNDFKGRGTFHCIACDAPLFRSSTKFDSGSGWPSFFEPIAPGAVDELLDTSHGMRRIEVRCANCGAHQGHVFPDGPPPSGRRFCINSVALRFRPDAEEGPR